ncbi:MAG: hypothetical protein JW900_01540 [Anaerolineae bacterium]|nr:hypothetical protein [Anaerolineae bacterium]
MIELLSEVTPPGGEDPLGIWSAAGEAGRAFSTAAAGPSWRVRIDGPLGAARSTLTARQAALERVEQDLARVAGELQQFALPECDFGAAGELSCQREMLAQAVARLQSPAFAAPTAEAQRQERQMQQQWCDWMGRVGQAVACCAAVGTEWAGALVGQTVVDWRGGFATTWAGSPSPAAMAVHRQSVQLALASRLALLRMVSVVASGAAGLALRAAIPGAQLALLPAVWRFVHDVLRELRGLGMGRE